MNERVNFWKLIMIYNYMSIFNGVNILMKRKTLKDKLYILLLPS